MAITTPSAEIISPPVATEMILPAPLSMAPWLNTKNAMAKIVYTSASFPAEPILDDLADGGPLAATIPGGHQPVERRDEHVLPLIPDRGKPEVEGGSRLRHGILGIGARAERLPDHDPPGKLPVAQKVAGAGADLSGDPQSEDRDADEVSQQNDPVQEGKYGSTRVHGVVVRRFDMGGFIAPVDSSRDAHRFSRGRRGGRRLLPGPRRFGPVLLMDSA